MDDLLDDAPLAPSKRRRWRWLSPFLLVSVALHLLFGAGAAYYVVAHYSTERKLTFHGGPKSPNPSERSIQHQVQMEQRRQTQSQPAALSKRVLTTGLAKVVLPPMPDVSALAKTSDAATKMSASNMAAGLGKAAPMSGGALGGTGSGSAINFFGIRDTSTSVVIMIDVSDSMFSRTGDAHGSKLLKLGKEQSFQTVRDEAIKLVQSLAPATRFGIVRWSGDAYPWQPQLVPATDANKAAAIEHIQSEVDFHKAKKGARAGGTRHDYALAEAFKLKPETIYMITDGNATGDSPFDAARKLNADDLYQVATAGQQTLPKKARLHTIYYLTGSEKAEEGEMLRQLAGRNGGKFQTVQAANRKE